MEGGGYMMVVIFIFLELLSDLAFYGIIILGYTCSNSENSLINKFVFNNFFH
jgi:hypothetical protein